MTPAVIDTYVVVAGQLTNQATARILDGSTFTLPEAPNPRSTSSSAT